MPRYNHVFFLALIVCVLAPIPVLAGEARVKISTDKTTIGMGESITLSARISAQSRADREGYRVLPFVNGKRWGAPEITDEAGISTHHIPLPNPGCADIQVLVQPPAARGPREQWIWGPTAREPATYYFQREFDFAGEPSASVLYVAVDDSATVYLNGKELGTAAGWQQATVFSDLSGALELGPNVLSVEARNGGGLAGLLVRLESGAADGEAAVVSDGEWSYFDKAPYSWAFRAEEEGLAVLVLSGAEWNPWRPQMGDWPSLEERALDMAGTLAPADAALSEPVRVTVQRRDLRRPAADPDRRVGIQYEPWFTPGNARWGSSHAVPLTGAYWSWNADVIRQQMIWLIESGIDFLVVDWTNHLWEKAHWDERGDAANEIIHATTQLLEGLAQLRDEGHAAPTVVLYPGLNNGPSTTVAAINEQLAWIHHTYVRNPRFTGLFELYFEKPLVLIHNGGGPDWADASGATRVDDSLFTVRYQSYQHEFNTHAEHGFWSWMDATTTPVVTLFEGAPEALTISTGFFSQGGWKKEGAYGRRGGWTLVEGFKQALLHRPRFLEIHQYQEFAGQWEGFGYGPDKDVYVDSYSVELSDDIEPVSLTAPAYRGEGGWGFLYLNLMRALIDCYHQPEPQTTVIALDHPGYGATVTGETLTLRWNWVGRAPTGFRLSVNGLSQSLPLETQEYNLDLAAQTPGPLEIVITAAGTEARYVLSHTEASPISEAPREAFASTVLQYVPGPSVR